MAGIFEADSPLLRVLGRIADVMILNLVFIATCLPIVTIGASVTALNYTAMKLAAGDVESVVGSYLSSFRQNFRQATALLGIVVLGAIVLSAWFVVAQYLDIAEMWRFLLFAVLYLVAFRFVIAVLYLFPYLAKFEGTVGQITRNARTMSLRHLYSSIVLAAVTALPVVITIFYPAVVAYGLLWFAIGFAGIAYVNAFLLTAIFSRYIPADEERQPAHGAAGASSAIEA